jgi:uncharacterized coiled-coil protein SlyX
MTYVTTCAISGYMASPYRFGTLGAPDKATSVEGPRRPTQASHRRLVITMVAGLVLIGGGLTMWAVGRSSVPVQEPPTPPSVSTASQALTGELLEANKALKLTQQETVDQLQIVQDQLAAQKLETKRLTEQITDLTEKLEALQTTVSNLPASSSTSAVLASKSHH